MVECKWIILKLVESLCNVAFIATVVIFVKQYSDKLTSTLTEVEERHDLKWPTLTFCTKQGFKTRGFHYLESDYLANTFDKTEIFTETTLTKLENTTKYNFHEIRSHTNGRCYSVHQLNSARVLNWDDSTFHLKRDNDLVLLVSYPGDEFFALRFIFPVPVDILDLPIKSQKENKIADLHLDLEEISFMPKNGRCIKYPKDGQTYQNCIRDKLIKFKRANYSCLTAYDQMLNKDENNYFETCDNDAKSAKENFLQTTRSAGDIFANSTKFGCPKTCDITTYNSHLTFYHQNTEIPFGGDQDFSDTFTLFVYYDTADVKKFQEHLVFDEMALLSAIGGTLGLLLGYSVLSIITSFINQFQKFLQKTIHSNE